MSRISDLVDRLLEVPVVPSFTRAGYAIRSRLDDWTDLADEDARGRVVVLTGGTSGIGLAAANRYAAAGATLVLLGRNPEKTAGVRDELATAHDAAVHIVLADMGEPAQVRAAGDEILASFGAIDALVHNAGALAATRTTNSVGVESTVASQVVGPHLLTTRLLDALDARNGRVITMSSGGMYTAPLTVSSLEMDPEDHNGTEQYARAKRAQVTLNEMWPDRIGDRRITFHALHPGWVDTPGVEAALPTFHRLLGPALRTADQGADTMVWLTLDDAPLDSTGGFWMDRRMRSIHRLPRTRRADTAERRERLWEWVQQTSSAGGSDRP